MSFESLKTFKKKSQLKTYIKLGIALSSGHFLLMFFSFCVFLVRAAEMGSAGPTFPFLDKPAEVIVSIFGQPCHLLPESWYDDHFLLYSTLWILNSVLWGFTLSLIILLVKKLKQNISKKGLTNNDEED